MQKGNTLRKLYAELRKVNLFYAVLRSFTQFYGLYASPKHFTQLNAHGNLLMRQAAPNPGGGGGSRRELGRPEARQKGKHHWGEAAGRPKPD